MADLIDRQAAIDIECRSTVDTNPEHFEANQKFTQFLDDAEISSFGRWQWANGYNTALTAIGIDLKKLPPAQSETDGLDAVRHARRILWDKCKKYLAEHTDEICPILYDKYQEEYTLMTNEVNAMSRAINIMESMKNRGEISVLPPTQPELRWIPVENEPPKKFNRYWVCTDTGYQCQCRWTNDIYGLMKSGEWGWSIFDVPQYMKVIAYMPLPKPYKRSEDVD